MRLIDADALVWKIMTLCRSYQKTHLVHAEMLETFTNSVLAYIDHAEEHKTEVKVIQYDSYLPAEPRKSTDQNVADVPSGDLISRQDAIDGMNKLYQDDYEEFGGLDIPECFDNDRANEVIKALPSADRPTVIRSKTLMPTKDFKEWAKRIREVNPNAVVIPCDAEDVSADRPQVNSAEWVAQKEREFEELHRPKGEWLDVEHEPYCECSVCGAYIENLDDDFAFCPRCGADMRPEK